MVNMQVCALDCETLRDLLQDRGAGQCLVLDCRSFFAFNSSHVRGSCNVRLSTIVRRRAKGAVGLEHILPNEEARARLHQRLYNAVVLLDERSADLQAPKRDSTLQLALNTLCREARDARICFLKGGYEVFSSTFPELCTKPSAPKGLTLPLSTTVAPGSADSSCSSCGTPLYDQGGPVEILPFLYLGSAYHASRKDMLDTLGITALINVSANCPNHFEGHYQYKSIPVEDNHKADISCWFNEAIDFIDSIKNNGGRVFVHCQAGISRSATICLAYLMRTNQVKLDEAFEFVKQRRSIISLTLASWASYCSLSPRSLLQIAQQRLEAQLCLHWTEEHPPQLSSISLFPSLFILLPMHLTIFRAPSPHLQAVERQVPTDSVQRLDILLPEKCNNFRRRSISLYGSPFVTSTKQYGITSRSTFLTPESEVLSDR